MKLRECVVQLSIYFLAIYSFCLSINTFYVTYISYAVCRINKSTNYLLYV